MLLGFLGVGEEGNYFSSCTVKPVYRLKGRAICDRVKSVVSMYVEWQLASTVVLMYAVCLDHVES